MVRDRWNKGQFKATVSCDSPRSCCLLGWRSASSPASSVLSSQTRCPEKVSLSRNTSGLISRLYTLKFWRAALHTNDKRSAFQGSSDNLCFTNPHIIQMIEFMSWIKLLLLAFKCRSDDANVPKDKFFVLLPFTHLSGRFSYSIHDVCTWNTTTCNGMVYEQHTTHFRRILYDLRCFGFKQVQLRALCTYRT